MNQEWMKEITADDMPNDEMKMLAEICGIEITKLLIQRMGGISVYIPRDKFCFKRMMKRYVQKNYNGRNARTLAVDLGVSQNMIYTLLGEKAERAAPNRNQIDLGI